MLKGTQTNFKDDKAAREYQAILMKPIVFNEEGLMPGTQQVDPPTRTEQDEEEMMQMAAIGGMEN